MLGFDSFETFMLAALIVSTGAFIQGCIGFGLALWSAPLLVLVDHRLVPGPLILATLVLILSSAYRERRSIDLSGVGWVLAGRLPGTLAGGALLALLLPRLLSVLLGSLVLLAVLISLAGGRFERTRSLLLVAGFVSGIMGTIAALGGPAVAVLYQHEQGPKIRSTLAIIFAVGASMSLVAVAAVGRLGPTEVGLGVALILPVLGGFLLSSVALPLLDAARMRTAVLVIAALGGGAAIAHGVRY